MFRDRINLRLQKGGFCQTPSNPPVYGPGVCMLILYMHVCILMDGHARSSDHNNIHNSQVNMTFVLVEVAFWLLPFTVITIH